DNGVWRGPHDAYEAGVGWRQEGQYPYRRIMGGDGMQVAIDTRDNATTYTGYQFGNYFRINTSTGDRTYITPRHELGQRPYRWNWQTPVTLSKHNQDILYMGSNKFHRSFNQGNDFETSDQDLTNGGKKGNVSFGTLTSIDESPLKFGLIYTGSDDGLVHVTTDGGYTFKNISQSLPRDLWVSRVDASAFAENRVYLSLNGYRWDNFEAYVYVSEDRGTSWKRIGKNLPAEPVNVIKEDPQNENILYVGTDHGVYVSMDQGLTFMQMGKDLPAVPVHDLVIHPRENDLILGTHGRSLYVADVSALQQMTPELISKGCYIQSLEDVTFNQSWGSKPSPWRTPRETSRTIAFYAKDAATAKLVIKNADGESVNTMELSADKGLNYVDYNYTTDSPSKFDDLNTADNGKHYLTVGKYTLELSIGGATDSASFEVKKPRERPKRKGSE
ncbi:MAG: glycosyl hydrolase, partial [Bacteroidota bacterium]